MSGRIIGLPAALITEITGVPEKRRLRRFHGSEKRSLIEQPELLSGDRRWGVAVPALFLGETM
jgi:hypothetical protein